MAKEISVFQELSLRSDDGDLRRIRDALLDQATAPWSHAKDREDKIVPNSDDDIIVFTREKGDGIEAVGLLLWSTNSGYKVTNVVPSEIQELGIEGYNAALRDFVSHVAEPASRAVGLQIEITPEQQALTDWVTADVAEALRRFSVLANKSTGSSHPSDRQRWLEFIFQSHRSSRKLDAELLIRWLVEIEKWPEDKAHDLAIQYEFGLELLDAYDRV